jgi:alkylation response protein AidB-like acyl-CoA dehydrogenase
VITAALAYERVGIARYARADRLLSEVLQSAGGLGALPAALRPRFVRALVHTRVARLMSYETIGELDAGVVDPVSASATRIATVLLETEASDVLGEAVVDGPTRPAVEDYWRYSRSAQVPAGAVDIQRMIVGRGLLGGVR